MCGIVVYFGDAPNKLTRILTGMWSIIYRAPDSTGLGVFADDCQPVRTRKAVGSVSELIDTLRSEPLYPAWEERLQSLTCIGSADTASRLEQQRRLLEFEQLDLSDFLACSQGTRSYPDWDDLVRSGNGRRLDPGFAGRPDSASSLRIGSAKDLQAIISRLIYDLDLPPLVVKQSLAASLEAVLDDTETAGQLPIARDDLMLEFEALFERLSFHEKGPKPRRLNYGWIPRDPFARKHLWRFLLQARLDIPPDFDRDGVRSLFRLLDASVFSSIPSQPDRAETIQSIFENLWRERSRVAPMDWRQLYRQEKALNVYGLAAAAALTWLQRDRYLPAMMRKSGRGKLPPGHLPGRTHPVCLRALQQPILAQGRWAIQSSVNLENAHPFMDAAGQRLIVLNGQFSSDLEARLHRYLRGSAGLSFRSTNSSEYFALLWGHYCSTLYQEQQRYQAIRNHVEMGLQDLAEGSQAIDHHISFSLKDKSLQDIDETAFIRAMRQMIRDGGQVAVTGMSQLSPETLYVASHNRPLFIVKRLDTPDYMVVSDVNAALGLFPQSLIQDGALELRRLLDSQAKQSLIVEAPQDAPNQQASEESGRQSYRDQERRVLSRFRVAVYALEGEEIFARIRTVPGKDGVERPLEISDFDGNPLPDIKPRSTNLTPIQIKKDLNTTFYETHLREVPDRMQDILAHALHQAGGATGLPQFVIEKRFLERRFGRRLASLSRLVLCGTGAAYNMAAIAKSFFQRLMPDLPVAVLSPVEIDAPDRAFNPDRDLVVLLSWSGTTADMVQMANDLKRHHVAMIGLTEKPFGDMGLIAGKSGGTIPILSGEEVTVSSVKSSLCMLFCLELFCLFLAGELGREEQARALLPDFESVPGTIRQLLNRTDILDFCQNQSARFAASWAHIIIDAIYSVGTGPEAAHKLEENSWTSMGKALDYRDVELESLHGYGRDNPIIVMATNQKRLQEALQVMQRLHEAQLPFLAVSYEHEELGTIRRLSEGNCLVLPKTDDGLQPAVDLAFAYLFGLTYGQAHGRKAGQAPRNLAKSVTASRSRPKKPPTASRELQLLEQTNAYWRAAAEAKRSAGRTRGQTLWEERAVTAWEGRYYRDIRRLGTILDGPSPLESLLQTFPKRFDQLTELILKQLPVDGEIVLAPLDRAAAATARNLAQQWSTFLGFPLRVDSPGHAMPPCSEGSLLLVLATQPPDPDWLGRAFNGRDVPRLWFGPPLQNGLDRLFADSFGCAELRRQDLSCQQCLLYCALSEFLIHIWRSADDHGATVLEEHFRLAGAVIETILDGKPLRRSIEQTVQDNRSYPTGLFIGPASGNGLAWVRRFDRVGGRLMEWYPFGESAHGPLVTVDPRLDGKYVRLKPRQEMIEQFGRERLEAWERRYLGTKTVDAFLKNPAILPRRAGEKPFPAEGGWYLPVLDDGYQARQDNLIIIDATSQRHFGQALDDLATFGCRFARMAVICQEAFMTGQGVNALENQPISHLMLLPLPQKPSRTKAKPVSEFLLPLAINLVGTALAALGRQAETQE